MKEVMLNIDHENIERILIGRNEGLRIPGRSEIMNQDTQLEDFWKLSRDGDWFILDGRQGKQEARLDGDGYLRNLVVYSIGKGELWTSISQDSNALRMMLSENNTDQSSRANIRKCVTEPATACG